MTGLPTTCVIDACAGIKLFLDEEYSENVRDLFERSMADEEALIHVPDLFYIECANILWKRVRRGEYLETLAMEHLADLRGMRLVPAPTCALMERALEIACLYDITAYDACYVALSERHSVPLVTADADLCAALSASPFSLVTLGG